MATERAKSTRRGRPPGPRPPEARGALREADVVVDVEFEGGLLFLAVRNLGELPAHSVRVKFQPPFRGLGGSRRIDSLALFRRLEFLAPGKSIRVFLDRAALFFAREEPSTIEATVAWRTREGERRTQVVRHDLEIYRDLPYVEREVSS